MQELFTFVVAGLAGGSSYALLALGLVLINNSSRILNFAQGEIGAISTFIVASLVVAHGWPWALGIVVGLLVGAAISTVTSLVLLQRRDAGRLPPLVGTVALLSLLTIIEAKYLGGTREFPTPFTGRGVEIFGVVLTPTRLLVIGSVAVICVLLWFLVEKTKVGLALRASADNRDAASIVGLNARGVESFAWLLAGLLGVLAGLFLGWTNQTIAPGFLTIALPRAFAAAILGGMTSMPGAVAGGLIVGVAESLTRWQWGQTPGSAEFVVFLILFLTLVFRPTGIFSRRGGGLDTESTESLVNLRGMVHVPKRARSVAGRAGRGLTAPLVLAGLVLLVTATVSQPTAYRLAYIPILGLLALSLNSFIAATGQLSLGHIGLYGLGAFMCGIAVTTWGLPTPMGLVVAALVCGLVALLLGFAALRVRGLYLAVLTLAFAVLLEAFVFPRPAFSRGGAGLVVSRPEWGPLDLSDEKTFLAVCIVVAGIVWLADRKTLGSPFGRSLLAVRQNETAAAARGVHPPSAKVMSFVLSGVGAGVAGALYAWRQGIVVASSFPLGASFALILYVVLGGIGSRAGVVGVTALFAWTSTSTGSASTQEWLTLGASAAIVLSIGRYPGGLASAAHAVRDRLLRRRHDALPILTPPPAAGEAAASIDRSWRPLAIRMPDGARVRPVLLAARHITVRFGKVNALSDVSVEVEPGQIVGVIGPNGAGKTTLFNALSGFIAPRDGAVWFGGRDISAWSAPTRAEAGLGRTFQQGGLALAETARANLLIAQHTSIEPLWLPSAIGLGPKQARAELRRVAVADQILEITGLHDDANRPAGSLPYGKRKLLELGCALLSRPQVLLLDEPAAGLADSEVGWLADVIHGIRSQLGIAVLVIEHHVPLVKEVADHVYVLNFGQILAAGDPVTTTNDPVVVEAYLGTRGLAAARGRTESA